MKYFVFLSTELCTAQLKIHLLAVKLCFDYRSTIYLAIRKNKL